MEDVVPVVKTLYASIAIYVFNLSDMVLSINEIKVLEKGLDFGPIQRKINKPELR